MKRTSPRLLSLFLGLPLLLLACRSPAPAPEAPMQWHVSEDLQIERLQDGIWLHRSWHTFPDGQRYVSNGLIVREGDRLVLVDSAWGVEPTEQLVAWIDRELRLPVEAAIATHHHDDRLGGWSVLARRGTRLLATPQTLQLAAQKRHPQPVAPALPAMAPGDALTLGTLEVFAPGPGHSADNLMVYLPRARLLFGGCAVKSAQAATLGNVADADLAAWPEAIRRAQRRYADVRVVVPGHDDPGGPELLQHTLRLLTAS